MREGRKAHPIVCIVAVLIGTGALVLTGMCVLALLRNGWSMAIASGAFGMGLLGIDLVWSGVAGRYPLSAEFFLLGDPP